MGKTERQNSVINNFLMKADQSKIAGSEADLLRGTGLWIMQNSELIGENAIDVDARSGAITCFMASLCKDKHFVGLTSEVESARKMAQTLGLTNVEFVKEEAGEAKGQFDTVLSFRSFEKNCRSDKAMLRFRNFQEQINGAARNYYEYICKIALLAADGGRVIAIENIDRGTEGYGILSVFNEKGMKFDDTRYDSVEYVDSASQSKAVLASLVLTKEKESPEDMFVKWAQLRLGGEMTPEKADYILFTSGGKIIEGYSAFDGPSQVVLTGIYENKDDAESFYMYRAGLKGKNILRMPMHRMDEAKLTISRDREIDKKNGFSIMNFSADMIIKK